MPIGRKHKVKGVKDGKKMQPQKKNSVVWIMKVDNDCSMDFDSSTTSKKRASDGSMDLNTRPTKKQAHQGSTAIAKCANWKTKLSSFAGRVTLAKATLSAMLVYPMGVFKFPASTLRKADNIIGQFIWKGDQQAKGIQWRTWKKITKSQFHGGLAGENKRSGSSINDVPTAQKHLPNSNSSPPEQSRRMMINNSRDGNPGSFSGTSERETPKKGKQKANQVASVKPPETHGYGLSSKSKKPEKTLVNSRPIPASSSKTDKKIPKAGVTISGPSTSSSKIDKGKDEVSSKIDTGKAKVGEAISGSSTKNSDSDTCKAKVGERTSGSSTKSTNLDTGEIDIGKAKVGERISGSSTKSTNLGTEKIDTGKANVGKITSGSSTKGTNLEKRNGKLEADSVAPTEKRAGQEQYSYAEIIDKGKAKVGVTISEPQKKITTATQKGNGQNAKGVTISEPKMKTNPGLQEQGKGKKVETTSEQTRAAKGNDYDDPQPVYHITWDGSDDESESLPGETCSLCQKNLSSTIRKPRGSQFLHDEYDDEYDYYFEQMNLPEVGVLGCGHLFHAQCLESITPDDQCANPPCMINLVKADQALIDRVCEKTGKNERCHNCFKLDKTSQSQDVKGLAKISINTCAARTVILAQEAVEARGNDCIELKDVVCLDNCKECTRLLNGVSGQFSAAAASAGNGDRLAATRILNDALGNVVAKCLNLVGAGNAPDLATLQGYIDVAINVVNQIP
ncbi:OLC1v1035412C1 [Oldenlandia corymbosa var. corymbosa]|uniref:OLC1v1035412C1 n=1 Tax=Oldenlandia corymbosa var. corymbosa TaxID=529605 RepID=A0AAV1CTT5_OLDCO|nr:OLC1v1035412C1 [Oldenlandia corymbosa var. corymbosa]